MYVYLLPSTRRRNRNFPCPALQAHAGATPVLLSKCTQRYICVNVYSMTTHGAYF